jgi:uroporphyrinogen-III decarboxylase
MGYPGFVGGGCEAPFDVLGDAFRGTAGVMLDMFRQKDTLLRALDQLAEAQIRRAVSGARDGASPLIFMPLHKGADGFMSAEQFETFYWPSLKRVCLGLIEEGLVPWLFAEGTYDSRLETVADLPRQSVIWYFDRTDMKKAKDVLGRTQCIMGNIPLSLMYTGTPRQIEDYCQGLIQVAGREGGFILSPGAAIDEGKADNIRAVMNAARRYGQYPLV